MATQRNYNELQNAFADNTSRAIRESDLRDFVESVWLRSQGAPTASEVHREFDASHPNYGADPQANGGTNTNAIQQVITDALNNGGGVVKVTQPGVYPLNEVGDDPYDSAFRHCIDLGDGTENIILYIAPGVELKLADGQQTDANGPVNVITGRNLKGCGVIGAGSRSSRIFGNTVGQTGWTQGYAQTSHGNLIEIKSTSGGGGLQGFLAGGLQLDDHFSNPINVLNDSGDDLTNEDVFFLDLRCLNLGEGPQQIGVKGSYWRNVRVFDEDDVFEGDGLEPARCEHVRMSDLEVGSSVGGGSGAACDLVGSQDVSVRGFDFHGWPQGFSFGQSGGGRICDDVSLAAGVIRGMTGPVGAFGRPEAGGQITVDSTRVVDCDSWGAQLNGSLGKIEFGPGCVFDGNSKGVLVNGANTVVLKPGVTISNTATAGSALIIRGASGDAADRVVILYPEFEGNAGDDIVFDVQGNTAWRPTGRLVGAMDASWRVANNGGASVLDNFFVQDVKVAEADRDEWFGTGAIAGRRVFNTDDNRYDVDTGSSWREQGAALTAADGQTVDSTYGTEERDVIQNLRTRVNELESRLQDEGVLS